MRGTPTRVELATEAHGENRLDFRQPAQGREKEVRTRQYFSTNVLGVQEGSAEFTRNIPLYADLSKARACGGADGNTKISH
jgi:hypothetical protein